MIWHGWKPETKRTVWIALVAVIVSVGLYVAFFV